MSDIAQQRPSIPRSGSAFRRSCLHRALPDRRHRAPGASPLPDADHEPHSRAATLLRIEISGALEGVCEIALSAAMTAHFAALLTGETPEPVSRNQQRHARGGRRTDPADLRQCRRPPAPRLRPARTQASVSPSAILASGARQHSSHHSRRGRRSSSSCTSCVSPRAEPEPVSRTPQPAPQPATHPRRQDGNVAAPQSNNRNLDLLLDIELGVTLRFGTRQMLLKDILELCSGSVVELDRRVEEPVDLLIDGRLIAQGEVVIVEGNYGLRILQVAAQGEKIACSAVVAAYARYQERSCTDLPKKNGNVPWHGNSSSLAALTRNAPPASSWTGMLHRASGFWFNEQEWFCGPRCLEESLEDHLLGYFFEDRRPAPIRTTMPHGPHDAGPRRHFRSAIARSHPPAAQLRRTNRRLSAAPGLHLL